MQIVRNCLLSRFQLRFEFNVRDVWEEEEKSAESIAEIIAQLRCNSISIGVSADLYYF